MNIFGWGVGDESNPFRKVAETDASVAAYRKFLRGEALKEDPMPAPEIPSVTLPEKIRIIERGVPAYVDKNGPARAASLMQRLDEQTNEAAEICESGEDRG